MGEKSFLEAIRLQNFLSYGSRGEEIKLERLNVLIGPNASGKSNLIEALAILGRLPHEELPQMLGYVDQWVWKGAQEPATIEAKVQAAHPWVSTPLLFRLTFTGIYGGLLILQETLEDRENPENVFFRYAPPDDPFVLPYEASPATGRERRVLSRSEWITSKSVLSQLRDVFTYPEITYLSNYLTSIHFYREWHAGPYGPVRYPQPTNLPSTHLSENSANLGLVLNNLMNEPETRDLINGRLREVYPDLKHVKPQVHGGQVLLFVSQEGLRDLIPVTRVSDGTLRYLCLLAILCHPEPPPLICLEEPEIGLYPEAIPLVGELLKEASEKTQLVVTTHSDVLVSCFTDSPESVMICERDESGSHLRRLESAPLKKWLEEYALGDLWLEGKLGVQQW